jgi:hypothetical protein
LVPRWFVAGQSRTTLSISNAFLLTASSALATRIRFFRFVAEPHLSNAQHQQRLKAFHGGSKERLLLQGNFLSPNTFAFASQ